MFVVIVGVGISLVWYCLLFLFELLFFLLLLLVLIFLCVL